MPCFAVEFLHIELLGLFDDIVDCCTRLFVRRSRIELHLLQESFHLFSLFVFDFLHLIKRTKLCIEHCVEDGIASENKFDSRFESELVQAEVPQKRRHREAYDVGNFCFSEDKDLVRGTLD